MIDAVFDQAIAIVLSARTELALFCLAFAIHYSMFGNAFSRSPGKMTGRDPGKRRGDPGCCGDSGGGFPVKRGKGDVAETYATDEAATGGGDDPAFLLRCSRAAYDRNDHRAVLRHWSSLRRSSHVPAAHLAQVVESMQRFKRDSATIIAEVSGYLRRNASTCRIAYINELLEPLAKSLDTEVVGGVVDCLPALGVEPNSGTYETLIHMHFATRSFDSVSELASQMRAKGLAPTARGSVILLKAALQKGQLDEAVRCFQEVAAKVAGRPTASAAPGHIALQLVELACRVHRVEVVLTELAAGRLQLTTEILNTALAECMRARDAGAVEQLQRLAAQHGVARSCKTYQMLIRHAGGSRERVMGLLKEMSEASLECTQEVVQAVLAVCGPARDVPLADALYAQLLGSDQAGHVPSFLALIRFYCEAGEPSKACGLYDNHLKALTLATDGAAPGARRRALVDARTERLLVNAALQCGREDVAAQVLEATPADTAKHIAMVRGCAARGNLAEAMGVFTALRENGAELTHSLWNTALDVCVEGRDLRRAEALMQEMTDAGVADVVSYNTLIKAHLRQENFARARALMDTMAAVGCAPNHVTYNELIHALVRGDRDCRRAQVWETVEEMQRAGVQPNRVTCSILLKSLKAKSAHADVQRTMDLTNAMEEPLDEVLLSSVVEACVRVGKPSLLAQKLDELQGKDAIAVTGAHTFGSLIKAYGYVKNMSGAWRCWKEMRSQHIKPTSITIGCMVEAVVTNGDIDGGYELVVGLLEDELCRDQVNAVVFGSVLKGYGRTRRMERVWAVFREMLARGIEPSVITFNAVIDACARNNQMDKVPELLGEMRTRGLQPNLITFSTMIKGFSQRGDMPAALATLEDIRKTSDFKPDEIVYNTLIDGCAQVGLVAEGERLFKEMQAEGVPPSGYTLAVLVKLLGQGRRVDRAFELVESVTQRYRLKPNSHVYGALIQACLQIRDVPRAVSVYEQAQRERVQPEGKACMGLVRGLVASGNPIQAASLLRTMTGLSRKSQYPTERSGAGPNCDDAFICEMISAIAASGGGAGPLAAALLADFKAARPRSRIDAMLERRVAQAAAAGA